MGRRTRRCGRVGCVRCLRELWQNVGSDWRSGSLQRRLGSAGRRVTETEALQLIVTEALQYVSYVEKKQCRISIAYSMKIWTPCKNNSVACFYNYTQNHPVAHPLGPRRVGLFCDLKNTRFWEFLALTLARTGGEVGATPLRFFVDSEKMAAPSAAGFWGTLWSKPCATFGKKQIDQVRSRSYDVIKRNNLRQFH